MIVAGAANILKQVVARAGVRLAEPVMRVEVTTEQGLVGTVLQDLSEAASLELTKYTDLEQTFLFE